MGSESQAKDATGMNPMMLMMIKKPFMVIWLKFIKFHKDFYGKLHIVFLKYTIVQLLIGLN